MTDVRERFCTRSHTRLYLQVDRRTLARLHIVICRLERIGMAVARFASGVPINLQVETPDPKLRVPVCVHGT